MNTNDDDLYKSIADELSLNTMDRALWTKAFAESGGDSDKAKARYILLRFSVLKKQVSSSPIKPPPEIISSDELGELRRKLQAKLAINKRATLYGSLGLLPNCSDADIATKAHGIATEALETGGTLPAETKYAIDILSEPYSREQYDRKLWDDIGVTRTRALPSNNSETRNEAKVIGTFLEWWESKKVSVIIGVTSVALLGYMSKGFFEVKSSSEVQKEMVKVQREAVKTTEKIEMGRVDNQRAEIEERSAITHKAIDRSAELRNRSLAIQETAEQRRRTELEYRANAEAERQELRRKEQEQRLQLQREAAIRRDEINENRRVLGEQRYWSCMRLELEKGYTNASANSTCLRYKQR